MYYCLRCGAELPQQAQFCARCGLPVPPMPVSPPPPVPPMAAAAETGRAALPRPVAAGRLLPALAGAATALVAAILISALLVVTGVVSLGSDKRIEASGYSSSEAAVQAYLDAMKRGDVDGMIGTFAVETYADNFDLEAYISYLHAYMPYNRMLPNGSVNRDLNVLTRLHDVASEVTAQYWTLSGSAVDPAQSQMAPTDAAASELVDQLKSSMNGKAFQGIRDAKVVDLSSELPELADANKRLQSSKSHEALLRWLGADEVDQRLARFSTENGDYHLLVDVYRYGSAWRIGSFRGQLASLQSLPMTAGGLQKI